jgi:Putative zinc-binding metallo-peptidase
MRSRAAGLFVRRAITASVTLSVLFAILFKLASSNSSRPAVPEVDSSFKHDPRPLNDGHDRSVAQLIREKYAIQVVEDEDYPVTTYHGLIAASNAEARELKFYYLNIASDFLLYPSGVVKQSRLKRIVLCRGLSFAGQSRAAVPDFEHDTLYYDVVCGAYSRNYQRHAIHHEFFHIIDYRDDGEVYSDESWARLNPQTFRYGDGGAKMQGNPLSGLPREIPEFLTTYATSGVEEDKAEMFAYMMTDYAGVAKRADTDAVIREKMAAMKRLLEKFCSEIDQTFWDGVSGRQTTSE